MKSIESLQILFASFFSLLLGPGINYATGVFHVALLQEYQVDVTTTVWVGALFSSMFALMAPVSSVIINLLDCRRCVVLSGVLCMVGLSSSSLVTDIRLLFLTFSLIAGLGTALASSGSLIILGYYFPDNTAVASGICVAGSGLGMFIHPALIQYLIHTYNLRGAFLITGAVMFHVTLCGMLMKPSKFEKQRQRTLLKGRSIWRKICVSLVGDSESWYSVLSNIHFMMFVCSIFLMAMGLSTIYLFLPDYLMKQGATFQEASMVISVSGIGSCLSRILSGFASSDENIGSFLIYISIIALTGVFTIFLPYFSLHMHLRIFYGFVLGLYTGGEWVFFNTITFAMLDLKDFATGVGVGMMSCGIGFLSGPPTGGIILTSTGNYYAVFLFCVAVFFSSAIFASFSTLRCDKALQTGAPQAPSVQENDRDINDVSEKFITKDKT